MRKIVNAGSTKYRKKEFAFITLFYTIILSFMIFLSLLKAFNLWFI